MAKTPSLVPMVAKSVMESIVTTSRQRHGFSDSSETAPSVAQCTLPPCQGVDSTLTQREESCFMNHQHQMFSLWSLKQVLSMPLYASHGRDDKNTTMLYCTDLKYYYSSLIPNIFSH